MLTLIWAGEASTSTQYFNPSLPNPIKRGLSGLRLNETKDSKATVTGRRGVTLALPWLGVAPGHLQGVDSDMSNFAQTASYLP